MKKAMTVAAVSGALLATLSGVTPAAADDAVHPNWLPDITDSASLTTPIIASGVLTKPTGQIFAQGSLVELYAWPAAESLAALAVDSSVIMTPLGKALVGTGGTFALRLEGNEDFSMLTDGSGVVDYEIRSWNGDASAFYSFSKRAPGQVSIYNSGSSEPTTGLDISGQTDPDVVSSSSVHDQTLVCGAEKVRTLPNRNVDLGQTHMTVTSGEAQFTYTNGAATTMGVGYSITAAGGAGSFKQQGTATRGTSVTLDFGARPEVSGFQYGTRFTYARFHNWCHEVWESTKHYNSWTVKPVSLDGGATRVTATVPATPAANCRPLGAGATQINNSSSATTNTTGVEFTSYLGIDLSSQAGYTSNVTIRYKNKSASTTRSLCGTNGVPAGSPGRLVLR